MALISDCLSNAEIKRLAALPRITKSQIFADAEAWLAQNRYELLREHWGKHICINARTLAYSIGTTPEYAVNQHVGPTSRDGQDFLHVILKSC